MTINELLVLMKMVRERLNELKNLRNQVSTKESYLYGREEKKVVEPQYNVKQVDKKITELELWLYKADSAVKTSNAQTEVTVASNPDTLLAGLE